MTPHSPQPLPAYVPAAPRGVPRASGGSPDDSCDNRCTGERARSGAPRLTRRAVLPLAVAALPLWASRARAEMLQLSEDEWRARLDSAQFRVLRQSGTEWPFSSPLNGEKRRGDYVCAACAARLFTSDAKFDSGTGWPSFWAPADGGQVKLVQSVKDRLLLQREVRCKKCDGHLGHVFKDGPRPTGLRYCINGVAMKFEPRV